MNTACALGRASGISMLSLGALTLGRAGATLTASTYLLLHYAILTAYTAEGGAMLADLTSSLPFLQRNLPSGFAFAAAIAGTMYAAPPRVLDALNSLLVFGAGASFLAVMGGVLPAVHVDRVLAVNWSALPQGELIPVLFVSCVYHNVVATVSMRLEGDRRRIRRAILLGSGVPALMFVAYNAVMIGAGATDGGAVGDTQSVARLAVDAFSIFAIATSFIGFVEGLTEFFADARQSAASFLSARSAQTSGAGSRLVEGGDREDGAAVRHARTEKGMGGRGRTIDYVLTVVPPVAFAAASPGVFYKALDVAGTFGIAVLFGALPAAMAWRSRRAEVTSGLGRMVGGDDAVLALVMAVPVVLVASRVWQAVEGSGL